MTDKQNKITEMASEIETKYIYGFIGFMIAMTAGVLLLWGQNRTASKKINKLQNVCQPYLKYKRSAKKTYEAKKKYKKLKKKSQKYFSELQFKISPFDK